jgi:hypothetical protein
MASLETSKRKWEFKMNEAFILANLVTGVGVAVMMLYATPYANLSRAFHDPQAAWGMLRRLFFGSMSFGMIGIALATAGDWVQPQPAGEILWMCITVPICINLMLRVSNLVDQDRWVGVNKYGELEPWSLTNADRAVEFKSIQSELREIQNRLTRIGPLQTKIDTMWDFQVRRAVSEVVEIGIVETKDKPLKFTDDAREALKPIAKELVTFYRGLPHEIKNDDAAVLLKIEDSFGQRLLDLVCIPCNLTHGACLLLAYSVAKQTGRLEINLKAVNE